MLRIYFFLKNFFLKILKLMMNFKLYFNVYLFLNIFFFFINKFTKKYYYIFYKKIKIYKYFFLNLLFFVFFFKILEFKENFKFFMKKIYIKIGNDKLNIFSLMLSLFWIIFTFLINIYNSFFYNFFFKNLKHLDLNIKIFTFRILMLFLFFIILFIGFNIMNLNTLILSILSTSIGLSLSLNIQKIINNYVSGLIILFDKNFRIGDAININGYQGVITQINNRYTVLRNLDCSEIIIPNEKFLIDVVQNQSLYFSKGNLRINVQISYNNNYKNVIDNLIKSLNGVERILETPPPIAYITNLTTMGLDMELSFWIIDAVRGVALIKSDVYINILDNFKKNKIELSYYKKVLKILE